MTLKDETGAPIKRNTFSVVEKSQPQHILLESFTNALGVLQAGDLQAGKTYLIQFSPDSFLESIEYTLPESATGVLRPEPQTVKHKQMSQRVPPKKSGE